MTHLDTMAVDTIAGIMNEHKQWSADELDAIAAVLDAVRAKQGQNWGLTGPELVWKDQRYIAPPEGTGPVTGFALTLTLTTDDIPDLLAYGRRLRDAEDNGSAEVTTPELAAREVAWLFAHEGTNALNMRGGVYAEIGTVEARPLHNA